MPPTTEQIQERLRAERNIWFATVRPNGAPHLIPIWFVVHDEKIYICTDPDSVKARNVGHNPRAALALENGSQPVIAEGTARLLTREDTPAAVVEQFKSKYDWDIRDDRQYTIVVEVTPAKWLGW